MKVGGRWPPDLLSSGLLGARACLSADRSLPSGALPAQQAEDIVARIIHRVKEDMEAQIERLKAESR